MAKLRYQQLVSSGSLSGSYEGSFSGSFTGIIPSSTLINTNLFIIQSGSYYVSMSTSNTEGSLIIQSNSSNNVINILNSNDESIFKVKNSGIVQMATQSAELTGSAIAGQLYFTSNSFFVGLE
jgi:hypothetical protein